MKRIFTILSLSVFVALLIFNFTTKAAVVYTDLIPDSTTTVGASGATMWDGIELDINSDGQVDCEFYWDDYGPSAWWMHISPSAYPGYIKNKVIVTAPNSDYLKPLNYGDTIKSFDNWKYGGPWISQCQNAHFANLGDIYVGIQFESDGNYYFGWILLSFTTPAKTLIVKSYAYESIPNTAIIAGDMGSTSTISVSSITIQGQGGSSTITTSGGTLQMAATVLPANATNNTVSWSVANGTGSATISSSGLLSATGDGTVTVTATANDNSGISGSAEITISNQSTILVSSITVQGQGGSSTITTLGGTLQMAATVLPANATNNTVSWSVANGTGSATISSSGLLSATGDGTVTITATANDDSGISGSAVITISNQSIGISEISNNKISVYPNPTSDFITIENSVGVKIKSVSIYSSIGKLVFVQSIDNIKETINVATLSNGLYFIRLELFNNEQQVCKIHKE